MKNASNNLKMALLNSEVFLYLMLRFDLPSARLSTNAPKQATCDVHITNQYYGWNLNNNNKIKSISLNGCGETVDVFVFFSFFFIILFLVLNSKFSKLNPLHTVEN